MAMQSGQAFQEKVARMLSRQNGKALLNPNKALVLKDEVANRKMKKGGNVWIYIYKIYTHIYTHIYTYNSEVRNVSLRKPSLRPK